jgi:membrane fusion protein, adhesin transport system
MSARGAGEAHESEGLRRTRSPRYARILAAILLGLLVTVTLLLAFVPWQQTAYGTGQIIAYAPLERQQIIEAPFEGRVVAWYVQEGTSVAAGDPITMVRDLDPLILERLELQQQATLDRLDAALGRVDRLDDRVAELGEARTGAVAAATLEIDAAEDRVEASAQKVEAARARLDTADKQLTRQRALADAGLTPRREVELTELEAEQAAAALREAQASLAVSETEVGTLEAELQRLRASTTADLAQARAGLETARGDVGQLRAELTELEGRLARQHSQVVVAPRAGTILRLVASEGTDLVEAGDPLAILVPTLATTAVELWMDGNDVPLVRAGQRARLQFEGWPALQVAGWPSLAIGTFMGRVELIDAAASEEGRVRILVVPAVGEIWPAQRFMRQGMLARGWVQLERVAIGWELWRQFNGFPPQLDPDSPFLDTAKLPKPRKPG